MIDGHPDLFKPLPAERAPVKPWRPRPLENHEWADRDYIGLYKWRIDTLEKLRSDPVMLADAKAYYAKHPKEFICHFLDTYNPRLKRSKWVPFVLFKRQADFIDFLEELRRDNESGLVEKCRDVGASWLGCAYSVWTFSFLKDDATGWGSRKEDLVDKRGDPDSLFEKMRLLINRMPDVFRPPASHAFMKLVNKENGATVTGEAGDNLGRGGRKSRYFVDEAQPLTAKILTPAGWQTMGDMRVGSKIINPDGGYQRVTHINDCGEHQTYRVIFTDGTSTECSENHKWVIKNRRTRITELKRTVEMLTDYRYDSPGGQVQYKYGVPITAPVKFTRVSTHPLHPYLVGALIGDGSVGSVPAHCAKITSIDDEVVQKFRDLLPEGCVIRQDGENIEWRIVDIRGRTGTGVKSRARQAIVDAGIAGMRSYEKHIPDRYKFASIDDRWLLLQGLLDTDGSVAKSGAVSYYTCSHQLALDVQFVVQSLGGTAVVSTRSDARGYRDQHVVHIATDDNERLVCLTRKLERVKKRSQQKNRQILRIEPIGKQMVRCISVDGPSQTYLTDHCIVTHNSAHIERAELIEASLGDNTEVRIDMSSVNGTGNMFHRRREAGIVWEPGCQIETGVIRVFIFDWRDHPEKDQLWYDRRKAKAEREGLQHVFAQEVERNYSAAVENTLIAGEWIDAAIDAHLKVPAMAAIANSDEWMAGLDLADQGLDRNALVTRQGIVLRHAREWSERDPGVTTRNVIGELRERNLRGVQIQYDSIGIGATVKSEFNRLIESGDVNAADYQLVPWNAGAAVVRPFERIIPDDEGSIRNKAFFHNFKAQAWWALRTRFYKVWRVVTLGEVYPADELISIDSASVGAAALAQLRKELAQPTRGLSPSSMRLLVNKTPDGTRSPNLADATVQAFFPAPDQHGTVEVGGYSG